VYSPLAGSQVLHLDEHFDEIKNEVAKMTEEKYQYTSYIDTANIMQGTKKLKSYEKRNIEF
jgi:hypothetical protein